MGGSPPRASAVTRPIRLFNPRARALRSVGDGLEQRPGAAGDARSHLRIDDHHPVQPVPCVQLPERLAAASAAQEPGVTIADGRPSDAVEGPVGLALTSVQAALLAVGARGELARVAGRRAARREPLLQVLDFDEPHTADRPTTAQRPGRPLVTRVQARGDAMHRAGERPPPAIPKRILRIAAAPWRACRRGPWANGCATPATRRSVRTPRSRPRGAARPAAPRRAGCCRSGWPGTATR